MPVELRIRVEVHLDFAFTSARVKELYDVSAKLLITCHCSRLVVLTGENGEIEA